MFKKGNFKKLSTKNFQKCYDKIIWKKFRKHFSEKFLTNNFENFGKKVELYF